MPDFNDFDKKFFESKEGLLHSSSSIGNFSVDIGNKTTFEDKRKLPRTKAWTV